MEGRDTYRELRLALAINGGVSLAVWMGGVVTEIDRFRCAFDRRDRASASDRAYADVLEALETVVVTDVVAGTSAGGINGAMLAYVVGNRKSLDCAGPDMVRDTWQNMGDFNHLLYRDGEPHSILRGDEVLLAGAARVFAAFRDAEPDLQPTASTWVRLAVTTTDSYGYDVTAGDNQARDHRLLMRFNHIERPSGDDVRLEPDLIAAIGKVVKRESAEAWPFPAGASIRDLTGRDAAAFLTRAARATAAFPFAFSPSTLPLDYNMLPLDSELDPSGLTGTPAMADVIETPYSRTPPEPEVLPGRTHANRFAVDGGVWDNSPFTAVLRAIDRTPAARDVKRVLTYIVGTRTQQAYKAPNEPPPLVDAFLKTLGLPSDVSFVNDMGRIGDDLRRQAQRLSGIPEILKRENLDALSLAPTLYPLFRERRLRDGAVAIAQLRNERVADLTADPKVPWLPEPKMELPAGAGLAEWGASVDDWQWGLLPVRNAVGEARRILRLLLRELTTGAVSGAPGTRMLETLIEVRATLSQFTWALDDLTEEINRRAAVTPTANALRLGWNNATRRVCGQVMHDFAKEMDAIRQALGETRPAAVTTETWSVATTLTRGGTDAIVKRALALEIVWGAFVSDAATPTVAYEFATIRPTDRWPLPPDPTDPKPLEPRPALAGSEMMHFSGFLKASKRLHDWMWGRIDGVTHLVDLLVDTEQLQRLCGTRKANRSVLDLAAKIAAVAIPAAATAPEFADSCRQANAAFAARGLATESDSGPSSIAASQAGTGEFDALIARWRSTLTTPIQRDVEAVVGTDADSGEACARLRADLRRRLIYAIVAHELPELLLANEAEGGDALPAASDLLKHSDLGLRTVVPSRLAQIDAGELHELYENGAANLLYAIGWDGTAGMVRGLAHRTEEAHAVEHAYEVARAYLRHAGHELI